MSNAIANLPIKPEEIDEYVDLDFVTTLAIDIYRVFVLKNYRIIPSVLLTEFFLFILMAIFSLPLSMVVLRTSNISNQDIVNQMITQITLGFSLLGILLGNIFFSLKAKQNHFLATLMEKVEKYNSTIAAITLLGELNKLEEKESNFSETIEVLKTTKEGLIDAFKVATALRKYHGVLTRNSELFLNLENNLTILMTFDVSHQTNEYKSLLNEALEIALSVHKEVKKIKNQ